MILGFDHVQLAMPAGGEDQARGFYSGILGMQEVTKPEPLLGRGGCWFRSGGVEIHVGVQNDFVPASKAHPALLVGDLEAVRSALLDAGAPVSTDGAIPRVRRLYALDPFGNRLELIQNGDGFSQTKP